MNDERAPLPRRCALLAARAVLGLRSAARRERREASFAQTPLRYALGCGLATSGAQRRGRGRVVLRLTTRSSQFMWPSPRAWSVALLRADAARELPHRDLAPVVLDALEGFLQPGVVKIADPLGALAFAIGAAAA